MKIPVIDTGCGQIAFWYEADKIQSGVPLMSRFAEKPDGSPVEGGARMVCGSCGNPPRGLEPQR